MLTSGDSRFRRTLQHALDWLFPPRCAGCGVFGDHWCNNCQDRADVIRQPFCARCGLPLWDGELCVACRNREYSFDQARAWARYSAELRQAILELKHRPNQSLGRALAKHLDDTYQAQGWDIDYLVPIPLASHRKKQRGFDQVELLAGPFAALARLDLRTDVLLRRKETDPQVGLTVVQRWKNLRNAFVADPKQIRGASVLLLDDIMTTGATLDAAARALKQAGAKQVFALTVARTVLQDESGFW